METEKILSIVIVNWNVRQMLSNCLASIRAQVRLAPEDYEVIVVDNASKDGSVEMVRTSYPDMTLIASPTNLGFGAGCNRGYAVSRGKFILLLNPDTVVLEGAVERLLETMQREPRCGIVGSCLINEDGTFQHLSGGAFPTLWNIAWNYLLLDRLLPKRIGPPSMFFKENPAGVVAVDWVSGAAMLLRREAIGSPLIFDESYFMYGEDWDVCYRLTMAGWRVFYDSGVRIIHFQRSSFKQQSSIDLLQAVHKGPRQFFARRRSRGALLVYDGILLAGYLIRWPLYQLLARLRPGRGYDELARFCRQFIGIILRSRFSRA